MELKSEVVKFRDGTSLTVTEANWDMSMRLQQKEEQASKDKLESSARQLFHVLIYPKLEACSTGQVPTETEAYDMPATELNEWYIAAQRVNGHWFKELEEPKTEEEMKIRLKKKERKRTVSISK
jgi:hypothetical protein